MDNNINNNGNLYDSTKNKKNSKSFFIILIAFIIFMIIAVAIFKILSNEQSTSKNNLDVSENKQHNMDDKRLINFGKIYYDEINNISIPYEYEIKEGLNIRKKDTSKGTWEYEVKQDEVKTLLGTTEYRNITDVFVYNDYLYFIAKKGNYFLNGTLETQYFIRKNISGGELQLLTEFEGSCSNFVSANEYIIFAVADNDNKNKAYYYSFNLNDYNIKKIHNVKQEISFLPNISSYVLPIFIGEKVLFIYNNDYIYSSDLNAQKTDEKAYELITPYLLKRQNYQEVEQEINDNVLNIKLKYIDGRKASYKNIQINIMTGEIVNK